MQPDRAKKIVLFSVVAMAITVIGADAAGGKLPAPKRFLAFAFVAFALLGGAELAPGLAAAFALVALAGVALNRGGPLASRFASVVAGGGSILPPPAPSTDNADPDPNAPAVSGTGDSNVITDAGSSHSGKPLAAPWVMGGGPNVGTHDGKGSNPHNWQSMNAVDLLVPCGTPVLAVEDGTIGTLWGPLNSSNPKMAGLRINLKGKTNNFYYAHLQRLIAPPMARVKKGQIIGYSGRAGPCHLHFAVEHGSPYNYLGK